MTLYTMKEITEKLKVSSETVVREIKAGRLQAIKIGKQWRFSEDQIDTYILSRTTKKKKAW